MPKPYGKNINMHKKANKRPSNSKKSPREFNFISKTNNTTIKNDLYYRPYKFQVPRGEGETSTQFATKNNRNPAYNNPFYLWLLDNAIAQIKQQIKPGAATSIDIANPDLKLGADYLLRKGDYFWIYNRKNYYSMRLQCDGDVLDTATSISIVSTTFKIENKLPAGSLIVPDFQIMTERVSNTPLLKRFNLTNTEYKNLRTSPYTLLPAETGKIHIPINCTILYNHGADEMTRGSLYIGHNSPSSTLGNYWGGITDFAYRERNDLLYQMGASTYASPGYSIGYPLKSDGDDGTGSALTLYTSSNFTSASSTITVLLYYKTIVI